MKKIAEIINGKTKTRYIYDIVATILIVVISFKMDFLNKQGQILGWTFNVGYVGVITAALAYNFTRMIHRKNNKGNWFSLATNFASDIVSIGLGDFGRVFGSIPNKFLTFGCGVSGLNDLKDTKKRLIIGFIFGFIAVTVFNLLGFAIFKAGFTVVAVLSTVRALLSFTAYSLQITRNGMATQITWTLYSVSGVALNAVIGNIPSLVKAIMYVPVAFLSIFTWKEKRDN
jgi:hypothetical protein